MVPSTPLLPHCAKTVSEPHPFHPMTLLFERKQIPRIVVTIRNSRNSIDRLEPISLPWAQGVGRSNRPAPTKLKLLISLQRSLPATIVHLLWIVGFRRSFVRRAAT